MLRIQILTLILVSKNTKFRIDVQEIFGNSKRNHWQIRQKNYLKLLEHVSKQSAHCKQDTLVNLNAKLFETT